MRTRLVLRTEDQSRGEILCREPILLFGAGPAHLLGVPQFARVCYAPGAGPAKRAGRST